MVVSIFISTYNTAKKKLPNNFQINTFFCSANLNWNADDEWAFVFTDQAKSLFLASYCIYLFERWKKK